MHVREHPRMISYSGEYFQWRTTPVGKLTQGIVPSSAVGGRGTGKKGWRYPCRSTASGEYKYFFVGSIRPHLMMKSANSFISLSIS